MTPRRPSPPQPRAATRAHDAVLPCVLPEGVARVASDDPSLAAALAMAGVEVVDASPGSPATGDVDAALVRRPASAGSAPVAVVVLGIDDHAVAGLSSTARAGLRLARAAVLPARVRSAASALRSMGCAHVDVVLWDRNHQVRIPGSSAARSLRAAERLPQQAVVVGVREGPRPRSLLDAALRQAGEASGVALPTAAPWPIAASGAAVALFEHHVLRVGVGPAAERIDRNAAAVGAVAGIASSGPAGALRDLVPTVLATGDAGPARWSLERRLPGARPPAPVPERVESQLSRLLGEAHAASAGARTGSSTADAAAVASAAHLDEGRRSALVELGRRVDDRLAGVPGGLGHGDLWHGNLLVQGDELSGILDWDAAGTGRLPLVDLLHLRTSALVPRGSQRWGHAIRAHLLPWAAAGGDAPAVAHCRATGAPHAPGDLLALAAAYWLDRAAFQLGTYEDRAARPRWVDANVVAVLDALLAAGA